MANKFTYQVLRDTTTDSVIKLTGSFDGTGQEANGIRIQANTLYGALATNGYPVANVQGGSANTALSSYSLQLTGLKYHVNFPTQNVGGVEIYWNGAGASQSAQYANSATIFHLQGQGEFGLTEQLPGISNNSGNTAIGAASVGNGDIGVVTTGAAANCAYTLVVVLRKDNAMYQRGQFNDPAAFNYGVYKLKP
jgi:hypothetical protein